MTVAAAVSAIAIRRGMQVILASSEEDAASERTLALDLCQRRVGGLILVPAGSDQSYLSGELAAGTPVVRSEEHTSEIQSLMRISYAVFCLKKKNTEYNK